MAHDVFISHSTKDKAVSDAVCAALEGAGIRCWIAPRDVQPGRSFAGEINRAIQHSKVMVLIFSAHSNNSEQVLREVQLAVNSHLHIIQFRIEEVRLNDDLEYFLSTPHWLDALTPPLENHIARLEISIRALLDAPVGSSVTTAAATEAQTPATVPQRREVSTARKAPSSPVNRRRKFLVAGAIVALLAAGVLAGWWFGIQQPRNELQNTKARRQRETAEQERLARVAVVPESTAAPSATINRGAQVAIIGYHRVVDVVRRPDSEITPTQFEEQLKQLRDRGVAVIGLQDFLAWKRGEKNIPQHCAILTFDDGWKSQYEVAWPILKKYGYPFTMFIYTEGVRGGQLSGMESMTWEQLGDMRDAGVDIQGHSATHPDLRKPFDRIAKKDLSASEYEQWLEGEVAGSKQVLEQRLGIKVNCFAIPYGRWNNRVKEVARNAGYEALFTVDGQTLTYSSPLDSLGRYLIEANKPKVFADAIVFAQDR